MSHAGALHQAVSCAVVEQHLGRRRCVGMVMRHKCMPTPALISLQESHDDTDARREALARFWDEVKLTQRALRPLLSALASREGLLSSPVSA